MPAFSALSTDCMAEPEPTPLSRMARLNSPVASGDATSTPTLIPPADSPKIVTRDGSPPNFAMLRFTHCSAAI